MHHVKSDIPREVSGVERRSLIKGAAWSVPVVAMAISAPVAAASQGCPDGGGTWQTFEAGVHLVEIPDCVTTIRYIVRGGGGAKVNESTSGGRNRGAEDTGILSLEGWTGGTLKVVVGAGGNAEQRGLAEGGIGYGRGGRGTNTANNTGDNAWSCGGGGGSAILYGSEPLIVSGGGGGASIPITKSDPGGGGEIVSSLFVAEPHGASGFNFGRGDSGASNNTDGNGAGFGLRRPNAETPGALVGQARSGNNGGVAATNAWGVESRFEVMKVVAGSNGGAHTSGLNGGGNGGNAAVREHNYTLPGQSDSVARTPAAGGGGGGYHGGAGGSFAFFRESVTDHQSRAVAASGGGGAGSSYRLDTFTDPASSLKIHFVSGERAPFSGGVERRNGHDGFVRLTWS